MTWKIGKKISKGKYTLTSEIKSGNSFTANVGMGLISYGGILEQSLKGAITLPQGTQILIQTFNDSVPLVSQERLCERIKLWQKVQLIDPTKWAKYTVSILEVGCEQEGGWFNTRKQWFWVLALPPGQNLNGENCLADSVDEDNTTISESITIKTAINYIQQIGAALQELHQVNPPLVHGFIAPDYIWLSANQPDQPLLLPSYTAPINKSSLINGFAAPEQYLGTYAPSSDVYGLGALLYWLITDNVFPAPKPNTNLQEYHAYNAITTGMAPALWAVLAPTLAYKPEERPSLSAWLADLGNVVLDNPDLGMMESEPMESIQEVTDPSESDGATEPAPESSAESDSEATETSSPAVPDDASDVSVNDVLVRESLAEVLCRAHALKAAGENEAALEAYQKVTAADPQHIEAWYEAGNVMARLKRFNEALTHYDVVLNLDPEYIKAWYNLGNVFKDLERYEEALSAYNRALNIAPNYHEAWNNRAIALRRLQQFDEAILSYRRAIDLAPEHQAYRKNLDLLLKQLQQSP